MRSFQGIISRSKRQNNTLEYPINSQTIYTGPPDLFPPEALEYNPGGLFRWAHWNTVYTSLFRHPEPIPTIRERVETPDGDFFDVDYQRQGYARAVVLLHGLEGSSRAGYIVGISHVFQTRGWDTIAVNFRGCGGDPNRSLASYHSGFTTDLIQIMKQADAEYSELALIGFSLGGNVVLKYLGESAGIIPSSLNRAAAISVPVDLESSAQELEKLANILYTRRFLKSLKQKSAARLVRFPGAIDPGRVAASRTLRQFDDAVTAPVNGFKDSSDYYTRCSSRRLIDKIQVSTLILNAQDDPFLGSACYPVRECRANPACILLAPRFGGHVGFFQPGKSRTWAEAVTERFINPD